MNIKGSHEAFWWSLFSVGGVVSAMVVPVLVFATIVGPGLGWDVFADAMRYDRLSRLLGNQLVKMGLFVVIALSLFHAFHRIRHLITDLHVPVPGMPVAALSYLLAIVGTVVAAIVLWLM
ncbi:MAG: fumarate reductase subunit D [Chloroflexota bacterium]|jgi:fumarate reductase subunit D|nr:fumarate reductase subunit D [Chloroflexota bacterium]MDP6757264.1 fumarate reductase subunit D [Chloroflexota bacterium]